MHDISCFQLLVDNVSLNCPMFVFVTASETFETRKSRYSGNDRETFGNPSTAASRSGRRDGSERPEQIPRRFHRVRRRSWQVSWSGRFGKETSNGSLGLVPGPSRGQQQQRSNDNATACSTGASDDATASAHPAPGRRYSQNPSSTVEWLCVHQHQWHWSAVSPDQITERRYRPSTSSGSESDAGYDTIVVPDTSLPAGPDSGPDSSKGRQHGIRRVIVVVHQLDVYVGG